ncbi:MAG: electron transfer flavoprotein subunit beta [Micrococcales bacterium 73-13]|nr:MAG: electron transfer flavoprotein subunit beta [Micrococcales bacterium 73-13]
MKIVVLVKEVPDTYGERRLDPTTGILDRSGDLVVDEIDERALEVALQYKDGHKDAEVVVLAVGPASAKDALRKGLSMGADRAVHVEDDALAGADALVTARAIAAALRGEAFDLVVAGNESTDGRGGIVPAMVAELLGLPLLGSLGEVAIADGSVRGTRLTETAATTLSAPLPAVVSVTEKSAEARFPNFKGIMTAKRKPLAVRSTGELGVGSTTPGSRVLTVAERPARAAGTTIADEGDAGERLVAFLRERKAI